MVSMSVISSSHWRLLGASVTGTDHQKMGRGCEDRLAYDQQPEGLLILTVADGAGSADRAAEGAEWAVQAAVRIARDTLLGQGEPADESQWHALLLTIVQSIRVVLVARAAEMQRAESVSAQSFLLEKEAYDAETKTSVISKSLAQFDTTLQLAIITEQWLAVMQIGDGAIIVQHTDDSLEALTWPDHGEYINETSFITEPEYLQCVQYKVISQAGVRGIALFTDGLELSVLDRSKKVPYEPFFTPLFRFASRSDRDEAELVTRLTAFLGSERFQACNGDDKTLLLAVRV